MNELINNLKTWFHSLEQRERLMVILGAIALVFAVFYFAIWQPLNSSLAQARTQVTAEAQQTRWLLGLREQAQMLRANSSNGGQIKGRNDAILAVIDSTSRSRGLADAVRRIQPDNNDEATVTLENARFNKMLYWLHMLQQDYNIHVAGMTVTQGKKPGLVQARLKLERGGA